MTSERVATTSGGVALAAVALLAVLSRVTETSDLLVGALLVPVVALSAAVALVALGVCVVRRDARARTWLLALPAALLGLRFLLIPVLGPVGLPLAS